MKYSKTLKEFLKGHEKITETFPNLKIIFQKFLNEFGNFRFKLQENDSTWMNFPPHKGEDIIESIFEDDNGLEHLILGNHPNANINFLSLCETGEVFFEGEIPVFSSIYSMLESNAIEAKLNKEFIRKNIKDSHLLMDKESSEIISKYNLRKIEFASDKYNTWWSGAGIYIYKYNSWFFPRENHTAIWYEYRN